MSCTGEINPWLPEPDPLLHQAVGKLSEESSELAKIATRCLIQGVSECDPGNGSTNLSELNKEIADVLAVIDWLRELRVVDIAAIDPRRRSKLAGFLRWQQMIGASSDLRPAGRDTP